jgi:biopolymer transport protein ExbD
MAKRKIQEINAGSMADIAFLLLIFFLVSTTMDTDSGIVRKLPPMPEEEKQEDQVDVKERNIFVVLVNRNNQLLVEGELMDIKDLRTAARRINGY